MTGARDDSAADKVGAFVGISACSSITRAMAVCFIQRLVDYADEFRGRAFDVGDGSEMTATPVGSIATADRRPCSMALER